MQSLLVPKGAYQSPGDARAMLESVLAARGQMPGMADLLSTRWAASPTSPELSEMLWKLSPTTETLESILKMHPDKNSEFYRRLSAEYYLRRAHITGLASDYAKAISRFEAISKRAHGKDRSVELICVLSCEFM